MSIKSKVFSFYNRIVKIVDDKSKNIIKYDVDNAFPQSYVNQIMESGTATSCVDKLAQYVYADGFSDESVAKQLANDKQTFNELANEQKDYAATFEGTVWYVIRGIDGKVAQTKVIPLENVRKTLDGNYVINETFGCDKYDKSKDIIYPSFRGTEITPEELQNHITEWGANKGEVFYYFHKKPLRNDYPIPRPHAAISDINTDSENSKFELESVNNSFITSGILNVIGDVDDKEEDDDGKTEWDYLNDTLEGFTGNKKDSRGETGRNKLAVVFSKTKEEAYIYTPISSEGQFKAIDASTIRVAEKVARAFGVPPFLIGLGGNVSFATDIISDNITLFNNNIGGIKSLIEEPLKKMFPDKDFTLTKLQPVRHILPEVLKVLTEDELRALEGYAPKPILIQPAQTQLA